MTLNAADKTRFLQALDDDPEFLQQVRQRLLSADLLELPERFAAFANYVNGFIAETQGFIAEQREHNRAVDTRLDGVDTRLDSIDRRLNRMDGRIDNALGTSYEAKVAGNFPSLAGRGLDLQRPRVLKGAGFPFNEGLGDLIVDAEDRGALTVEEVNNLMETDLIAVGRSRANGQDLYVAAEASITLGDQDVERAAARAGYLAKATGQATAAVVVAENVGPEQAELARRRQVTVLLLPSSA